MSSMQIADTQIIRQNERALLDTLVQNLDWRVLEKLIKDKLSLGRVEFKNGDIIIRDDKVAYKLDLEVKVRLSLIVDRDGDFTAE